MSVGLYWTIWFLTWLCQIYLLVLVCRAILSWIEALNPSWRPKATWALFFANLLYALTDPPLKIIGKFVKPLRFGGIGLDLSFIVLFLAVMVLQRLIIQLAYL